MILGCRISNLRIGERWRNTRAKSFSLPNAQRQLMQLRAFDQRRIVDVIGQQLVDADPRAETRNKFALDPAPESADYELRVGSFRVLYRVEETEPGPTVIV